MSKCVAQGCLKSARRQFCDKHERMIPRRLKKRIDGRGLPEQQRHEAVNDAVRLLAGNDNNHQFMESLNAV